MLQEGRAVARDYVIESMGWLSRFRSFPARPSQEKQMR